MRERQSLNRETMPKWPAWVLFATMAACAYPAVTASADAAGREPARAAVQPDSLASALTR